MRNLSEVIARAPPKVLSGFTNTPVELSDESKPALASIQPPLETIYDVIRHFALETSLFRRGKIPLEVKIDLRRSISKLVEIKFFN